MKKIIRQQ